MYIPERRGSLKVLHENEVLSARMASLKTIPVFTLLLMVMTGVACAGDGDGASKPTWLPQLLGAQFTANYQNTPGFHSPYTGQDSFTFDHSFKQQMTRTYGVYLGSQVTKSLQLYADFEMFQGAGLSRGLGLGAYTNADVIRAGPADLGSGPYLARLYARYIIPLSGEMGESLSRGMDQLPDREPVDRIEIKGGKLAPTDDFDQNRYANNGRTQFLNYAFLFNTAWDYASDTRGYSIGASVAFVHPAWRLIFGSYQVPTTRNGMNLDDEIYHARGDNVELSLLPGRAGTVIRLLAFHNEGRMGDYREAMTIGSATGTVPSTLADEQPGRTKYGFGLNIEQPLANGGETGLFARLGWANGANSAWSYTEVDRDASMGLQVSGINWGRPDDRFGIAVAADGLTGSHRHYLEEGGIGMLVGDGALNYGLEEVFETYYRIQLGRFVQLSPDFQYIENPGYNRDRGPVKVYGMRLHMSY
jgi:hypothetical protein